MFLALCLPFQNFAIFLFRLIPFWKQPQRYEQTHTFTFILAFLLLNLLSGYSQSTSSYRCSVKLEITHTIYSVISYLLKSNDLMISIHFVIKF